MLAALGSTGCHLAYTGRPIATCEIPRELDKAILPPYRIEPPDILLIDAMQVIPKSPYYLKTLDSVAIRVRGTLPDAPIDGAYMIKPGGILDLGFTYGSLKVAGMTVEEVQSELKDHLKGYVRNPQVVVTVADLAAKQQISGEHLVALDGTVTLGSYGSVQVVGKTIAEAKQAIEDHLDSSLDDPEVSVDVFAYNSKVYYVITQGAGLGDGVYRFPVTGNETVLDAISLINGLDQVSSKKMWIARAGRNQEGHHQILPIDWIAITENGDTETNYQIMPGDRIFVAEDKLILIDTIFGKIIAPFERVMGFSMLGASTLTRFTGRVLRGGGNPRGSNF